MSRIVTLALTATTALGLAAASIGEAGAAPLPALNAGQVGGPNATVDHVGYRGGYYGGRGYHRGYGYRRNAAGAAVAGAALGLIGGAIVASTAPRYGYGGYGYGDGYYGAGYGGYGGYGYGDRPVYGGYGYRPVYGYGGGYDYGYPGYGW